MSPLSASPRSRRRRVGALAVAVLIVVGGLVLGTRLVCLPRLAGLSVATTGTPDASALVPGVDLLAAPHWSEPLRTSLEGTHFELTDVAADALALLGPGDLTWTHFDTTDAPARGSEVIDLATMTSLWHSREPWGGMTGPGVLGAETGDPHEVRVVDVRTGTTIGAAPLGADETVVALAGGWVVTTDMVASSLCVRAVTDLTRCAWTQTAGSGTGPVLPDLIGRGTWLETGSGVFDLATGAPASFGADGTAALADAAPGADTRITYSGDDPVYRVVSPLDYSGPGTTQRWDTATDAAASAALPLCQPGACLGSTIAVTGDDTYSSLTAYSWETGRQLWQVAGSDCRAIVGGSTVLALHGETPVALSAATGSTLWTGDPGETLVATGTRVAVYDSGNGRLVARDAASPDLAELWMIGAPVGAPVDDPSSIGPSLVFSQIAGHVVAFAPVSGTLWVLRP